MKKIFNNRIEVRKLNLKRRLFNYIFLIFAIFSFTNVANAEEIYTEATCIYDFQYIIYGRDENSYFNDQVTINLKYENGSLKTSYKNDGGMFSVNDVIYNDFINKGSIQCPNYLIQINNEINETSNTKPNIEINDYNSGHSYGVLTDSDYKTTEGEIIPNDDIRRCTYKYESEGKVQYEVYVNFNLTKNTMTSNVIGKNGNSSDILLDNELVFEDYQSDTCPTAYLNVSYENNWAGILILSTANPNLTPFGGKLSVLVNPLNAMQDQNLMNLANENITVNNQKVDWQNLYVSDYICTIEECQEDPFYHFAEAIVFLRDFCQKVYSTNNNNIDIDNVKDCINYQTFYTKVVEAGYFTDLSSGCDFVTDDLQEKLIWVLDIIKIAGPILALGLGTLDFIKVLASGDADKEMKTAFKRFSIRIVVAILLFIIPVILAFLMDIFIGNQDGYNSDNPFCNVVEWE